jgi:vacuolar-type H+-ATPase subunit H
MLGSYKKKEKELEDMIETIKDDEKKKATDARNEFSAYLFNF